MAGIAVAAAGDVEAGGTVHEGWSGGTSRRYAANDSSDASGVKSENPSAGRRRSASSPPPEKRAGR
jgi:hypothetical protein